MSDKVCLRAVCVEGGGGGGGGGEKGMRITIIMRMYFRLVIPIKPPDIFKNFITPINTEIITAHALIG